MGTWDPKYHKGTEFFSTYEPHEIAEELDQQLAKLDGIDSDSIKKDPKKWRLSFNLTRKVKIPLVAEEEQEEQEAQEEDEQEESKVATAEVEEDETLSATVIIKLLKVPDEDKLSVEFSKAEGSSLQIFYEAYLHLSELLTDYNDTA